MPASSRVSRFLSPSPLSGRVFLSSANSFETFFASLSTEFISPSRLPFFDFNSGDCKKSSTSRSSAEAVLVSVTLRFGAGVCVDAAAFPVPISSFSFAIELFICEVPADSFSSSSSFISLMDVFFPDNNAISNSDIKYLLLSFLCYGLHHR